MVVSLWPHILAHPVETVVGRSKLTVPATVDFRRSTLDRRPSSVISLDVQAVCVQHDAHEIARRAGPSATADGCVRWSCPISVGLLAHVKYSWSYRIAIV